MNKTRCHEEENACCKHNMHYGVTFHHEYTWWWWQTAFGADKTTLGEGDIVDGKLKTMPGGNITKIHADFPYTSRDIRFTIGKDGLLYIFTMNTPKAKEKLCIKCMALGKQKISDVTLLGHNGKIEWQQTAEGLSIVCPQSLPCPYALTFCVK